MVLQSVTFGCRRPAATMVDMPVRLVEILNLSSPELGRRPCWRVKVWPKPWNRRRHAAPAAGERWMELTEDDVLEILKLFEQSKFDFLQLEQGERKITVSKGGFMPARTNAALAAAPARVPPAAAAPAAAAPQALVAESA